MEATRGTVPSRGFDIAVRDHRPEEPSGDVVLALHGFPDTGDLWDDLAGRLAADGIRTIAPDTLGCGRSDLGRRLRDYRVEGIVADLIAVLDHLGIDRVRVVGHDWGAVIGWFLTIAHPERVAGFAAMSVGHPTVYARAGLDQKRAGWYVGMFVLGGVADRALASGGPLGLDRVFPGHPDMAGVLRRLSAPGRMTAALRIYRANAATVLAGNHPPATVPVIGVWSDRDPLLVRSQMERSAERVDAPWQFRAVEDCGHWIPFDQPQATYEIVTELVAMTAEG